MSNAEKRKIYDQYGNEDPDQHFQHYRQYYSTDDIRAEDIFDMFFGMQRTFGDPNMRRGRGQARYYRYNFYL